MAKPIAFSAIMVTLLSVGHATKVIVTTVVDDFNQQGRCVQEMRPESRELRACQRYLTSPFESRMIIRQQGQPGEQSPDLTECCQAFENIEERCRCTTVRAVVSDLEQHMQHGQRGQRWGQQEMQQIRQWARSLPQQCNMRPQECPDV